MIISEKFNEFSGNKIPSTKIYFWFSCVYIYSYGISSSFSTSLSSNSSSASSFSSASSAFSFSDSSFSSPTFSSSDSSTFILNILISLILLSKVIFSSFCSSFSLILLLINFSFISVSMLFESSIFFYGSSIVFISFLKKYFLLKFIISLFC